MSFDRDNKRDVIGSYTHLVLKMLFVKLTLTNDSFCESLSAGIVLVDCFAEDVDEIEALGGDVPVRSLT